jgi:hypothetical protein
VLNAVTVLVIGHVRAEAAIGQAGAPGGLDGKRHPLLAEAARSGAGADEHERFRYATSGLLAGLSPDA